MNKIYKSIKLITYLGLFLIGSSAVMGQTTILQEDFETDGNGSRYTEVGGFSGTSGDYFVRTDGVNSPPGGLPAYSGQSASFYYAGEDTQDGQNPNVNESYIEFTGVSISGFSDLKIEGLFACGAKAKFDPNDYMHVYVNIDGGGYQLIGAFEADITSGANSANFGVDADLNGAADGPTYLSTTFDTYSFNVGSTGTSMDVKVEMLMHFGDEEAAFDNIKVTGNVACTAPSTQANAINFTSVGDNAVTVNWTGGDGDDGVIVLVKEGSAVDANPSSGATYTANAAFGSGDEIGTGNRVVYLGGVAGADNIAVTGLTQGTTYHFAVYELNSTGTCYLTPGLIGSQATTTSAAFDSDITAPTSQIIGGTISSLSNADPGTSVFRFNIEDMATSDGFATIINKIVIEEDATNDNVADWSTIIEDAKLINNTGGGDVTATVTINADNITIDINNGDLDVTGTVELELAIWLKTAVVDGEVLDFKIPDTRGFVANAAGSGLTTTIVAVESGEFTVDVTATVFEIDVLTGLIPSTDFPFTATAQDANGNVDLGARNITLSRNAGTGILSSALVGLGPLAMTNGVYSWTDLQHDTSEDITIDAVDGVSITTTSATLNVGPPLTSVFFSEYIEGSSNNKALEIYNATGSSIDLSQFSILRYSNGGATGSSTDALSGTLVHGEVFVIGNSGAGPEITAEADMTSSATSFNGDDAVSLSHKGVIIDFIGDNPGVDPGSGWDVAGVTNATANHTLVRKSTIVEGNATQLASFGTDADDSEWIVYPRDDFTYIGSHFTCATPSTQATLVTFGTTNENDMVVNWTQGNGTDAIVLMKEVSVIDADPSSGTAYTANADFIVGEEVGTGNMVVFAGSSATQTVTVSGLTQGTTYHVSVFEYNSSDNCYNTDTPATGSNTTATSNDTDSDITAVTAGETSNIDYSLFQDGATLTTTNSASLFKFSINDKATTDGVSTIVTGISFDITNHENIRTLALFEGANATATVELDVAGSISTDTLTFSALNLEATTGASLEITVRATFLDAVDDSEQIQLTISNATADGTGSSFDTAHAGGVASDISTADLNAIVVTATLFDIAAPTSTAPSSDFAVTVTAADANGNTDIDARSVTLSRNGGAGVLSSVGGLGPVAMTNGVYSWADVQHDTEEIITVDVTDGGITSTSSDISITMAEANIIITELADPNNNTGLRYIELYNAGDAALNFTEGSGWRIDKYTNASTTVSQTLALTGTIPTKGFYIIATGAVDTDFATEYGVDADQFDGAVNDVAGSNGDDNLELYDGSGTLIDQFGVPGEDGNLTPTTHEFEDGRAERKPTVTIGNPLWDVNEWNIDNDGSTFPGNGPRDAPDDFDPASWIGTGGPLITIDVSSFSGDFGGVESGGTSASNSFSVIGGDLTDDVVVTAPSGFSVSLDDVTFTTSVMLTQSGGVISSTAVYARFEPSAVQAYSEDIVLTSIGATDKVVAVSGTGLGTDVIFYEDFSSCDIANYNAVSITGDQIWSCTTNGQTGDGARMSGFDSNAFAGVENEDWLITSVIDLSSATNATLTFVSDLRYATAPTLEILTSSDYTGSGDPTTSTWTALPALLDQDVDNFDTWTASGDIDLNNFVGGSVYIAFKYTSTTDLAPTWSIDDILIEDRSSVANPSFTITESLTDFGTVDNGSVSASQSFSVTGSDLTADIDVTAPASFEVSLDNTTFSSSVNLAHAGGTLAATDVHVRFAPASGSNGAISSDVTISTDGTASEVITVSGTEEGNETVENDLFFSEYIEPNGGSEKAIEIYNGTGADIDLSTYMVRASHNGLGFGNDGDTYDLPLTGTVVDGDVFIIYSVSATDLTILAEGDLALTHGEANGGSVASYNGNDALGLFKDGVLIDVIGDPNNDPGNGSGWDVAGVSMGTLNHTLIRKSTISTGNIAPLGSFGTSTADSEWEVLDENTFSNLGSHTGSDPVESGFALNTTDFVGDFGSVALGEVSAASSYSVSGAEITGDFTITIPVGFEASLTSDFTNKVGDSTLPLSITPSSGTIDNVTVYVRFKPGTEGALGGNLVNSVTGYPDVTVAVTGTGTAEVTGLEELSKHNISVYPNPTEGILNISIPESFGAGELRLVKLDGSEVLRAAIGAVKQIETSKLRSGIYLLQIKNNNTVINHRVVIQ